MTVEWTPEREDLIEDIVFLVASRSRFLVARPEWVRRAVAQGLRRAGDNGGIESLLEIEDRSDRRDCPCACHDLAYWE